MDDPLHIDTGGVDRIGIDITGKNEVLYLCDRCRGSCCHDMVEIPCGLSIFQVSLFITHIGMDKSIVES